MTFERQVSAPGCADQPPGDPGGLLVDRIVVKRGRTVILDGMSLEAAPGEVTGLLGPNGAGKTTALHTIAGLLRPLTGSVTVYGAPIADRRVGYSPQGGALYPLLTARENIEAFASYAGIARRSRTEAVREALALAQLEDRADNRVSTFSGGMRQRLSLAIATLNQPDVLLLDEPTVGVDPQARAHILDWIGEVAATTRTIVVYSSHYMDEIEALCARVVIIDHGSVLCDGQVADLRHSIQPGISFGLDGVEADDAVVKALSARFDVRRFPDGGVLVSHHDIGEALVEVVREMSAQQLTPRDLRVLEPSLEQVFIELTGRRIRD